MPPKYNPRAGIRTSARKVSLESSASSPVVKATPKKASKRKSNMDTEESQDSVVTQSSNSSEALPEDPVSRRVGQPPIISGASEPRGVGSRLKRTLTNSSSTSETLSSGDGEPKAEGDEANDNDDDEDEESDDADIYEMEQIQGHKKGKDGKILYRVRWKGYPPEQDTWEPVENFIGPACKQLLRSYWDKCKIEDGRKADAEKSGEKEASTSAEARGEEKKTTASEKPKPASKPRQLLSEEDMESGTPTALNVEPPKSEESSEDSEDERHAVLLGMDVDESELTKEQKRLVINDRKLDQTEKLLRTIKASDDGRKLTRTQLRKMTGQPLSASKREPSVFLETPSPRKSGRARKSTTPKIEEEDEEYEDHKPKSTPKPTGRGRGRRSTKKSATPLELEEEKPAEKKAKLTAAVEKVIAQAQDEYMDDEAHPDSTKDEPTTQKVTQSVKAKPSPTPSPAKPIPITIKKATPKVEKVEKSTPKTEKPIPKPEKSTAKPVRAEKPKVQETKKPAPPPVIPPPEQMIPTDAKTPAELKAEMMAKKKGGAGTKTPLSVLKPSLKKMKGPSTSFADALQGVSAHPPEIPSAKIEERRLSTQTPGLQPAKKSDEMPPEEPKPKSAQKSRHRDLSADLPMEITQGIDLADFVLAEIRKQQQIQYLNFNQKEFDDLCMDGNLDKLRPFLRHGANGVDLNKYDEQGRTILHKLCNTSCDLHHSVDEVIDLIVTHGGNLELPDLNGRTPLHLAVLNKSLCHVRKLLSLHAPLNVEDTNGNLPIFYATSLNDSTILGELLNAGAAYHRVKNRHQLIKDFDAKLTKAFNLARTAVMTNITVETLVTPIFVNTCWEKSEITLNISIDSTYFQKATDKTGLVLTIGIGDYSNSKDPRVRMWGSPAFTNVSINGKELSQLVDGCRYIYSMESARTGKNQLKMMVHPEYTKSAMKILTQICFIVNSNGIYRTDQTKIRQNPVKRLY